MAANASDGPAPVDPVDRAHLTGASRPSPPIHRYAPDPALTDVVTRYWFPVWSVPVPQQQSTLQHPVCLIVVSDTYARLYGVARGLSTVTLEGTGWAAGVMLRPAAGRLVLGGPVSVLNDGFVELTGVDGLDGAVLVDEIRGAMAEPSSPAAHETVIEAYEQRLRRLVPLDDAGRLINRVIDWLDAHPEVSRVSEVAAAFELSERRLQRLVEQRVGWSPKWLIQRRRLHDAVLRLKRGDTTVGDIAADLGYADQAHFTHDFRAVSGMTPGEYRADQPTVRDAAVPRRAAIRR